MPPDFKWSTEIQFFINPSLGVGQEIPLCRQGRIGPFKSNPSLVNEDRMTDTHTEIGKRQYSNGFPLPMQLRLAKHWVGIGCK